MRRGHRAAHRRIWLVLAFLLPAVVVVSMALRRVGPLEAPAMQLSPPE